ncbi:hypothetical protein AABB24_030919, partial [Solanum stoloniferum]
VDNIFGIKKKNFQIDRNSNIFLFKKTFQPPPTIPFLFYHWLPPQLAATSSSTKTTPRSSSFSSFLGEIVTRNDPHYFFFLSPSNSHQTTIIPPEIDQQPAQSRPKNPHYLRSLFPAKRHPPKHPKPPTPTLNNHYQISKHHESPDQLHFLTS